MSATTTNYKRLCPFDAWASAFGETVTAVELKPEGTGYRTKTRFSRFFNLPELMAMFKEVADIKTADMLELPVPAANYHNVAVKPSDMQKEMVASLAERAEKVRSGMVNASVDNMLKITNDGRKLALDQRMINDMLPDFEGSKVNACVDNIYRIWEENSDKKSAQLVFCDLSTPKGEDEFSVYTDIRKKLIERGIPADEVRFIHEADTEVKKQELFKKVRKGEVRVLLGSTQKMGAGTNCQDKLIALHDIDCPWRPSDLEQRSGRIIRQGNTNPEVEIFRYVTEGTFDAYNIEKRKGVLLMNTNNSVSLFNSDLDLESYLSKTITQAGKNDEALKSAKQRVAECKNRIPKLTKVLDLENPAELTVEECKVLIEYLLANNRLAVEECRICYMRGLVDGIETKKTFE